MGFSVLLMVAMSSCNKRDKEIKEIDTMTMAVDSILKTNPVLTVEQRMKTEELALELTEFSDNYPNDSLSPQYLYQASMLYHVMPDYRKELRTLDLLVEKFPDSPLAPQALATAARVCEESKQDIKSSRDYLTQIKEKYPNSPYAVNIDLQIEYAGDAEGLLRAIMEKKGMNLDSLNAEIDSVDAVK